MKKFLCLTLIALMTIFGCVTTPNIINPSDEELIIIEEEYEDLFEEWEELFEELEELYEEEVDPSILNPNDMRYDI